MKIATTVCCLVLATILSETNALPFFFLPRMMLPQIGSTFNFTFNGFIGTMNTTGVYTVQAVTAEDNRTVIGYRNWQLNTGDFNGIFYGVSYTNGTYMQALIDSNTNECINVFDETVNCTDWSNVGLLRYDNLCSIVRVNTSISGFMYLTVYSDVVELTRPVNFVATATISGSPDKTTITNHFSSKIVQNTFPPVKCYF